MCSPKVTITREPVNDNILCPSLLSCRAEASPHRQTLAFHGEVNAKLRIWARKCTLCFFRGMSMYVKDSVQETVRFHPLKKEQSLRFSVLAHLQFSGKSGPQLPAPALCG